MIGRRVLVTGGAGFIGAHSVKLLLEKGYQVLVLDNLSSGSLSNLDLTNPDLEFIEGDILEYPLIVDLLAECDAILHLAAIASVPLSIEDPIYTFQVNTQGLLHVLQAIFTRKRPIRLVYASSAAVYGDAPHLPSDDESPLTSTPLSPYALQKMDDEAYADLYRRMHTVSSLGLRYFNVYGPLQDPHSPYSGVISRFVEGAKADRELIVYGDGLQSRDFIHVSDIAHANLLALESAYNGVLNIATGKSETLLDLIKYIGEAHGCEIHYRLEAERSGDIRASYGQIEKAKKVLGFEAKIDLKEGVKSVIL